MMFLKRMHDSNISGKKLGKGRMINIVIVSMQFLAPLFAITVNMITMCQTQKY